MVALRKVFILLSALKDLSDTALVAGITKINFTRIITWLYRALCPVVRPFMTFKISVKVIFLLSENKALKDISYVSSRSGSKSDP